MLFMNDPCIQVYHNNPYSILDDKGACLLHTISSIVLLFTPFSPLLSLIFDLLICFIKKK